MVEQISDEALNSRIAQAEARADRIINAIDAAETAAFEQDQKNRKDAFRKSIESGTIDVADYWAKPGQYKSFFGANDMDDIAAKAGGYRPNMLVDTGKGIAQTLYKSQQEIDAQNQMKEAQLKGAGMPTSEVMKLKRSMYDREQRQLWAGLGAGVLHNWYKKGMANVGTLAGDLADYLPAATQSEIEFGAGQLGAYAGTGAGLYGATVLPAQLLRAAKVSSAAKAFSLQDVAKDIAIKNLPYNPRLTGAIGNMTGAAAEGVLFDTLRREDAEQALANVGTAVGVTAGLETLGLAGTGVARYMQRLQDNKNLKLMDKLLETVGAPPNANIDDVIAKGEIPKGVIDNLPEDLRIQYYNKQRDLVKASDSTPMTRAEFDVIDSAKPESQRFGDYDAYVKDFNEVVKPQLVRDNIDAIKGIVPKDIQEQLKITKMGDYPELIEEVGNFSKYRNIVKGFNFEEFAKQYGGYGNVWKYDQNQARKVLTRLDNLYEDVQSGLIPKVDNLSDEEVLQRFLKNETSGIKGVLNRENRIKYFNDNIVTKEGLRNNTYDDFKFVRAGLDQRNDLQGQIGKLSGQLDNTNAALKKYKVGMDNANVALSRMERKMNQTIKNVNGWFDMLKAEAKRYADAAVRPEKNAIKSSLLSRIQQQISGEYKPGKFKKYMKLANNYMADADKYFDEKALDSIATTIDEIEKGRVAAIDNWMKQFIPEQQELMTKADRYTRAFNDQTLKREGLRKSIEESGNKLRAINKDTFAIADSTGTNKYTINIGKDKTDVIRPDGTSFEVKGKFNEIDVLERIAADINTKDFKMAKDLYARLPLWSYMQNAIKVFDNMGIPQIARLLANADAAIAMEKLRFNKSMKFFEEKLKSKENMLYNGSEKAGQAYNASMRRIFQAIDNPEGFKGKPLNAIEQQAKEWVEKEYSELGAKLGLTPDQMKKNYITHAFDEKTMNEVRSELYDKYGELSSQQIKAKQFGDEMPDMATLDAVPANADMYAPDEVMANYLKKRSGRTDGLVEDAFLALDKYTNDVFPKIYYTPEIEKINAFLYLNKDAMPETIQRWINGYLRDTVTKYGSESMHRANKAVASTVGSLAEGLAELPFIPQAGKKYLKNIGVNNPRFLDQAMGAMLKWAYGSKMAFNPTSIINQNFQKTLIYPFGDFKDIVKFSTTKAGNPASKFVHPVTGEVLGNVDDFLKQSKMMQQRLHSGFDASFINNPTNAVSGAADRLYNTGFTFFKMSDINNVRTAFLTGMNKALKDGYNVADAIKYGEYVAETTQFAFSRAARSAINRSPWKMFTTFSSWTMGYMNYLQEVARTMGGEGLMKSIASQYVVPLSASALTGYDFSRQTPNQIAMDYTAGVADQLGKIVSAMPGVNFNVAVLYKAQRAMEGLDPLYKRLDEPNSYTLRKMPWKKTTGKALYDMLNQQS